jgi:isopropylmalate/homocitrate/citramalate synthase
LWGVLFDFEARVIDMDRNSIPARVRVVEVGGRDGFQNETRVVPTDDKVRLLDLLSAAGLDTVEVGSFVRPDRIPALADTEAICKHIHRRQGVRYVALVPNAKGLDRASAAEITDIAVFTAASDTFNRNNINMSVAQSLAVQQPVVEEAKRRSMWVRGYVSTGFGCPYEGEVEPGRVRDVVLALHEMGVDEISLGDTIGVATPNQVETVVALLLERIPIGKLALHMHDTRGTALANVLAGMQMGIAIFDSSAGGLGGCPYAPGASGNLATEDLVYMLDGMGVETGVDLAKVVEGSRFVSKVLGRPLPSRYLQACSV